VKPETGARIHDTITRLEYKEDNGDFMKVKARMCVRGDQQIAGVSFKETDLYAPVLRAAEARLLLALVAANGDKVLKTNTKQAYLYDDIMMGDDVVYNDSTQDPLVGGQSLFQKDTSCSYSKAFMEHCRQCGNGMNIFRAGWKGMDMRL
jgi:hypothetical protein